MKTITNLIRVLKAALQNIFRNAWLGIATVMVLVLALTSVNLLIGVNALLEQAVGLLEEKVDITVFFKRNTNEALVTQARFFLADLPQVKNVELMTAEESLTEFKARHVNDPDILKALEELDENPLGATMRIKARNTSDYPFIIETLKNPQFADAIESRTYDDHQDSIAKVEQLSNNARYFGTALIIIFILIGVLIVYNTIRVAIYTQREEIGIMRLVGASSTYLRSPFVIQGTILAGITLLLTAGIVALGIMWIEPILVPLYDGGDPGLTSFFSGHWLELLLIEGGALVFLVGLTSWAAVGKYVRR